jgi:hypothetical protein
MLDASFAFECFKLAGNGLGSGIAGARTTI